MSPASDRTPGVPCWLRAALLTLGPAIWLLADHTARAVAGGVLAAERASAAAGVAALAAGALVGGRLPRLGRACIVAGVAMALGAMARGLLGSPALALVTVVGAGTVVAALWLARPDPAPAPPRVAMRASAYGLLAAWLLVVLSGAAPTSHGALALLGTVLVHSGYAGWWIATERPVHRVRATLVAIGVVAASTVAVAHAAQWPPLASWRDLAVPAAALIALAVTPARAMPWDVLLAHPARLLVVTFLALCVLGTALLMLPEASTRAPLDAVDAVFTAVSAVCVTGLIVLDTPHDFTLFGQGAILMLIQLGGLGIMTFYSVALSALGRRLSLRHETAIAEAMAVEDRRQLFGTLGRVLRVTFVAEALGAVLLAATFAARGEPVGEASWRGVFTAVSAFCNAGFALQSDSLIPYASDPRVLHTVAVLIVVGGLSPAVVTALPAWVRGRRVPSLQLRLIVITTAALLLAGMVFFLAFEWNESLAHLGLWDRLQNAWFQSVTLRTAGFNSVDTASTAPATQTLMIAFMFIGGSPGGTAGGIKTTTFAVLLLAVVATLRHRQEVVAFSRRLGPAAVYKAASVITLGVLSAVGALVAIELTQDMALPVAVFEVISALGTVGLSVGGTAELDGVGKILIVACMFTGRVGPLTLFLFLTERRAEPYRGFPAEQVDVG